VIAFHHGAIQFANAFNAFLRVSVITDHVTQTQKMSASTLARISQNCFKRLEISVDIAQNCKTHYQKLKPLKG
jgi:hypothetical protein